jgi:hypothetical protein
MRGRCEAGRARARDADAQAGAVCGQVAPSPSRTACLLVTELFNTASPERQGAGLQHREDVAVEAMDRAALLPLLQAVPRCSTAPSSLSCPGTQGEPQPPFTLLWTRPSSRGWTEPYGLAVCLMTAVLHRTAAQTRRRLRAGHRAEPVVCRCRCLPQRARSLALQ